MRPFRCGHSSCFQSNHSWGDLLLSPKSHASITPLSSQAIQPQVGNLVALKPMPLSPALIQSPISSAVESSFPQAQEPGTSGDSSPSWNLSDPIRSEDFRQASQDSGKNHGLQPAHPTLTLPSPGVFCAPLEDLEEVEPSPCMRRGLRSLRVLRYFLRRASSS